MKMLNN